MAGQATADFLQVRPLVRCERRWLVLSGRLAGALLGAPCRATSPASYNPLAGALLGTPCRATLPASLKPPPALPPSPPTPLQLDAAAAMDLDDMAQLDQLTNELLGGRAVGPPPAASMPGGPNSLWPAPAAPMLPRGMAQAQPYSISSTPSSSDTLTATQPLPPYLAAPPMQPAVARPGFGAPLLGGTPFSGSLQPPPPLPGAMRMPGAGTRVESPASGRSTGTGEPGCGLSSRPWDSVACLLAWGRTAATRCCWYPIGGSTPCPAVLAASAACKLARCGHAPAVWLLRLQPPAVFPCPPPPALQPCPCPACRCWMRPCHCCPTTPLRCAPAGTSRLCTCQLVVGMHACRSGRAFLSVHCGLSGTTVVLSVFHAAGHCCAGLRWLAYEVVTKELPAPAAPAGHLCARGEAGALLSEALQLHPRTGASKRAAVAGWWVVGRGVLDQCQLWCRIPCRAVLPRLTASRLFLAAPHLLSRSCPPT